MARRNNPDLFYDTLKEMSGNGASLVSNKNLKNKLGWEKDKYDKVKKELLDSGWIMLGAGNGGTVNIIKDESDSLVKVFVSYSHVDKELQTAFVKHLEPLQRNKLVQVWHDGIIEPGKEWANEIKQNLEQAHIIILLISIDFMNSYYCHEVELKKALSRHNKNEASVIPVIARACSWKHESFAKLHATLGGKAISTYIDKDEALMEIANIIKKQAEEIQQTL